VELTYADGTTEWYGTDLEHWKAGIAGPVKHAGIFDGEEYDARQKMGYDCIETLVTPEENKEFRGQIFPTNGAEVYLRHDLTLSPAKAYIWNGVEGTKENEFGKVVVTKEFAPDEPITLREGETLVVDFGQNSAAVPAFVFKAKEGTVLTCLPGELLNDGNGARSRGMDGPEGSVHRENLRAHGDCFRVDYTFAGDKGFVTYHPTCTFFGYRFISVTATDEVTFKSIRSIPVTSIAKEMETGFISTGNELINKLISNPTGDNYQTISPYLPIVRSAMSDWDGQPTHRYLPRRAPSLPTRWTSSTNGCVTCAIVRAVRVVSLVWPPLPNMAMR
jgi:alpha-L-rhamnosidase